MLLLILLLVGIAVAAAAFAVYRVRTRETAARPVLPLCDPSDAMAAIESPRAPGRHPDAPPDFLRPPVTSLGFYDPSETPTPDALRKPLMEFHFWLERQTSRTGERLVNAIRAKQQDEGVVLYAVMNPAFVKQNVYDRHQFTESIWYYWQARCIANRTINSLWRIHVVLLHPATGEIIGGSLPENSKACWVSSRDESGN